MKVFLISWIILFSIVHASCGNTEAGNPEALDLDKDFRLVEINDLYTLQVPKYMKEAQALNSEASLQYQNVFKETYVIIIDEDKQEFIDVFQSLGEYNEEESVATNYANIQLNIITESINIYRNSEIRSLAINGLEAKMIDIDARVDDIADEISYQLTFIEGRKYVYMIMAWTMKDRMPKYKGTFGQIARSFSLL